MQRRERVAQSIGPQSLLVLFSTEPRVYANDVDYPYRQENNLYYLTNLKQKNATLVLLPGNTKVREILFLPRRNASDRDVERPHVQRRKKRTSYRASGRSGRPASLIRSSKRCAIASRIDQNPKTSSCQICLPHDVDQRSRFHSPVRRSGKRRGRIVHARSGRR